MALPFCLEVLGLVWHLPCAASMRKRKRGTVHSRGAATPRAGRPLSCELLTPTPLPRVKTTWAPGRGPRDALGMACGAPQQSSQMAEETLGFLNAFLHDFPAPPRPESPLPWKVPGAALSPEEVEGELVELAMGFLGSR